MRPCSLRDINTFSLFAKYSFTELNFWQNMISGLKNYKSGGFRLSLGVALTSGFKFNDPHVVLAFRALRRCGE